MRRELEHKLEQLSPLLRSEDHWDQAVELLVSLDEPKLWQSVLDTMDERHLDRRVVGLLARMPEDAPGVREKRRSYRFVQLNSNSLVDAELTPNIERVSFVRTSYGPGSSCPPWFAELRKLARLKHLELNNADLTSESTLEIPHLERLRLNQCGIVALPDLPSLARLELQDLRGPQTIGTYPALKKLELLRNRAAPGALGGLLPFMSAVLEDVMCCFSSLETLDFLRSAIEKDAPLRSVALVSVPRLASIEGVRNALELRILRISRAPIDQIDVVSTLPRLRTLAITHTKVASLEPLRGASELRELQLQGCTALTSLAPLVGLPNLQKLTLTDTRFTSESIPAPLRAIATWPASFAET